MIGWTKEFVPIALPPQVELILPLLAFERGTLRLVAVKVEFYGCLSTDDEIRVPRQHQPDGDKDRGANDKHKHNGSATTQTSIRHLKVLCIAKRSIGHRCNVKHRHPHVQQEQVEIAMVEMANTIRYPGAVVVHAQDARSADVTVVRTRWLDALARATIITESIPVFGITGAFCFFNGIALFLGFSRRGRASRPTEDAHEVIETNAL